MEGNIVQLVKLRSPWSKFDWKGDWSDDSDCWTSLLRSQLGWERSDDGQFWMDIRDVEKYFQRVVICKVAQSH